VAALDEAFSRAAQAAVSELVDGDVRKSNKAAIDKEIVGRARLWVAKFTVTKDETNDGRRELTVLVRIDRDKLRARLGELNIATTQVGEAPKPGAKTVVVLMRLTTREGTRASYGATAEKELPGMGAFAAALRGAGWTTKRAPASGPAAKPGGELPMDDGEAEALGAEAKADVIALALRTPATRCPRGPSGSGTSSAPSTSRRHRSGPSAMRSPSSGRRARKSPCCTPSRSRPNCWIGGCRRPRISTPFTPPRPRGACAACEP
jgi:hypothetical protein